MDGWMQAMLLTAFSAGLLGGVHCAAMCGGIVGMVSASGAGAQTPHRGYTAFYNAGRILS